MVASFQQRLQEVNPEFETFESLRTLQVNLGNLCNLYCSHCHVNASFQGTEIMSVAVMDQIVRFLSLHSGLTLDITGGCPEMNPNFRYFIDQTDGLAPRRILRSNLAIMAEPGWEWLPEFCRSHGVTIIGSLPCYMEENVDRQRGNGVYQKCIQILKQLNALGYGTDVELDLVYNPGGGFIPGSQTGLEEAYKSELLSYHNIAFNHLFTITNAPIGRFREQLQADGNYTEYLDLLAGRFNPEAAGSIMCRSLISVDWQGKIYNCDFNQAIGMPVTVSDGSEVTIAELDVKEMSGRGIRLSQHCYCCTAGEGSSCTGALAT
jgi:radical SAM/Cys-rich protein